MLEAGRIAPSSQNHQPWDFVLVTDRQMMIAAADQGIGTGHSAVGDQDLTKSALGVPEDKLVAFIIDLGYPADRPLGSWTRLKRRPFGEVVHRDGR